MMRRGQSSAKVRTASPAAARPPGPGGQPRATAVHNEDIAVMFDEMADLLELEGENPFRIRAYRNASRVARDLGRELSAMVAEEEDLTKLPGIGKDLAQKIREIVVTGESDALRALEAQTPPA